MRIWTRIFLITTKQSKSRVYPNVLNVDQKPRTCAVRRFLQMEREFSSPRALMGKVTLVGTVSEYLPFIFSKRLLAKVGPRRSASAFWGLVLAVHSLCLRTLFFLPCPLHGPRNRFEQRHCAFQLGPESNMHLAAAG